MKTFFNKLWLAALVGICTCGISCDAIGPREVSTDFGNYKPLAAIVAKADKVVVYEGLPHQAWEGDLLEEELKAKETVKLHEFPFYAAPVKLKAGDTQALTKLFTAEDSLVKFGGEKLCGGFHPDYCIEWHIGKDIVRCLVCFGCHEVKVYGPKSSLRCDIKDAAYKKFETILKAYRQQRPMPKTPASEKE